MEDAAITRDEARAILSKDILEGTPAPDVYGPSKPSVDLLRVAKPAEDLTSETPNQATSQNNSTKGSTPRDSKIETVFEKLEVNDKTDSNVAIVKNLSPTDATLGGSQSLSEQKPLLKEDNLFSSELTNELSNSIYSVSGAPSARINRRHSNNSSNVFPAGCMGCKDETVALNERTSSTRRFIDATEAADCPGHIDNMPKKRNSTAKIDTQRNPLTGVGMEEAVEGRRPAIRRKDGNPVLGVGYEESNASISSNPANPNRIPPGGYSHRLW